MASFSKLNLACGKEYLPGYWNVDDCSMWPDSKVDSIQDIITMKCDNNTIDEIRVSHFIMYTRPEELQPLLKRWYGWLKEGGKFVIESSDFRKLCEIVLNNVDNVDSHGKTNIFGNPTTCPHRWGWSPDEVIFELYNAGFKECSLGRGEKKPDRDFKIIAIK